MSRKLRAIVFVLLTAAAAILSFAAVRSLRVLGQAPARRPFTAVMVEKHYRADSAEPTFTYVYLRAFRSDGSDVTVRRGYRPPLEGKEIRWFFDLTGGKTVTVDGYTDSVTTSPMSERDVRFHGSWPKSECTGRTDLPRSTVLGYQAVKVQEQLAGGMVLDLLMAPALDCFALEEHWNFAPGAKGTRQALYVVEGEPAPALFGIPATYVERLPSEVAAEFARRYPELGPPYTDETARRGDEKYYRARSQGQP